MNRKLIIDGNAVYEIDEECMLRRRLDQESGEEKEDRPESISHKREDPYDRENGRSAVLRPLVFLSVISSHNHCIRRQSRRSSTGAG